MNQQTLINNRQENLKSLLASLILAKGAIRLADGSIRIVTVHELSTRYEFYIVHKIKGKTARAARKTWKRFQDFARDYSIDYKPYEDFGTFVEWYARRNNATVLSMRLSQKGRLADVQKQTAHESLTTDWSPIINSNDPRDFRNQNRRLARNISGRVVDEIWRGR